MVETMQAVSDEQLMLWLQQGDESCLGALFERHHGNLFSFCLHLVKDRAIAEDLVQEAFLRVLGKRRSYRGGSFKAWLYNIARNLAFDHHRRCFGTRLEDSREPSFANDDRFDIVLFQLILKKTCRNR